MPLRKHCLLFIYCFLTAGTVVQSEIIVVKMKTNITVYKLNSDVNAHFGPLFQYGQQAFVVKSEPINACNMSIVPPPLANFTSYGDVIFVALIQRGECSFVHKVMTAQKSGYSGVLVFNNDRGEIGPMGGSGDDINIPSRMITLNDGQVLQSYTYIEAGENFIIVLYPPSYSFNPLYIIMFLAFISLGFVVIGIGFAVKLCRDFIKRRANRLRKCHLKKIPIKKFVKGQDSYETCAICLDDYKDGDKLRILPCSHAYHSVCIDPWLLKQKRNCPVCKNRVHIPGHPVDSEDNEEESHSVQSVNSLATEQTPLIPSTGTRRHHSYNSEIEGNVVSEAAQSGEQICHQSPTAKSDPDLLSVQVNVVGHSINNDHDDGVPTKENSDLLKIV